ncbi:MAG TPA: hypothetical protein VHB72_01755 [Candidatus Saccharimonadales bacterium]|jgi:hypothetical protein|nr:hypothetical protein [Candidatus Saccharimonadales bacterium]
MAFSWLQQADSFITTATRLQGDGLLQELASDFQLSGSLFTTA